MGCKPRDGSMLLKIQSCNDGDVHDLAELRARAMKPSLQALGRYDAKRVRARFISTFVVHDTKKVVNESNDLVACFVLRDLSDHLYLDHLYVDPRYQGYGVGSYVMDIIKAQAREQRFAIKLGALRESLSNAFYQKQGFIKTHEEAFDIYYIWQV